jgi:beta-N-acetylhexosaminidase
MDEKTPACLSKTWVTDVLRKSNVYEGIIFSDDIFMGALADNGFPPEKAAVLAIEAGVDCIMTSEKRFAKQAKLLYKKASEDKVFASRIDQSVKRILEYKIRAGLFNLE